MLSGRRKSWSFRILCVTLLPLAALLFGAARPAAHRQEEEITYTRHIAPILYKNCLLCHRTDEIAPFPLATYEEARKRAKQIAVVAQKRFMPPWKADSHGEFLNELKLTDEEIGLLTAWAEAGAPPGDPAELPSPPQFTTGWRHGEPDDIITMPEPFSLGAEGRDEYRCFVIPTNYDEDRWLAATEFHPGNRKIVHHITAYVDMAGIAERLDTADPGPGYASSGIGPGFPPAAVLAGWAPGKYNSKLPDGIGTLLPKGGTIVMEVHYHKSGKPETDLSKIGLYFSKAPVDKRLRVMAALDPKLYIPAGRSKHIVRASVPVPADITLLDVTPHMHLLGKEMTVTVVFPDKTQKRLVRVTDWDFFWQTMYEFKKPVKVPRGSQIRLTALYDNSKNNPRNPHKPPRDITWGEQTSEEMCAAFLGYTVDAEQMTKGIKINKIGPDEFGNQ